MAFDEGEAEVVRTALGDLGGVTEKRMFGGLCYLLNGNMLIGVHGEKAGGGAMFRVGPDREEAALALPGAKPMTMTGRRMRGFVDLEPACLEDEEVFGRLLSLATAFVSALPPK